MTIYRNNENTVYRDIVKAKVNIIYNRTFPPPDNKIFMIDFYTKDKKFGCIEISCTFSDNYIMLNGMKYGFDDIKNNEELIVSLINYENTLSAIEDLE